jgi:hypothetical protein
MRENRSWLRRLHLTIGLAGIVAFLATGQYMDLVHDHLSGMDAARRMLFRSAHIYLLLSSLLNLALGLYLVDIGARVARVTQLAGSLLIAAGPLLLLLAFAREPWLSGLDRPYARPALYGTLAGALLHGIARLLASRSLAP